MALRLLFIVYTVFALQCQTMNAQTAHELVVKGIEYAKKSNFSEAMSCFTKGMKQAESERDSAMLIASTGYIGNVYYNIYDYPRSLQYLLKGYNMALSNNSHDIQSNFLTNIVAVYCKMNDSKNAWHYFQLMERTVPSVEINTYYYYLSYNRARIATTENKPHVALQYHRKALEWAERKQMDVEYKLFQYCEIGQIYLSAGQPDTTISYGKRCIEPARKAGQLDLLTSVYKMMADAYAQKGETGISQSYQRSYLALSDSLFNRNKIYSVDKELVEYETLQTNEHIDSLNGVISRQTMVIIAISLIVIILVVFSLTLYRYNRKLRMAHRTLIDKDIELQKAESNREEMLQQWIATAPSDSDAEKNSSGLNQSQSNMLLQRIMKTMNNAEMIANPDFSLNMLADAVGSNTKYVSAVINDSYGKNFKTLLNECRIRQACMRLSDPAHYGKMTIQAIYEEVGYTNAVSFIRAFKKVNGMTPSEYQHAANDKVEPSSDFTDK